MSVTVCRCGAIVFLLYTFGACADTLADWADTTTEIATDGPNTIRTMALAQNAVYEAVNAITSRYPRDHLDLGAGLRQHSRTGQLTHCHLSHPAEIEQPRVADMAPFRMSRAARSSPR